MRMSKYSLQMDGLLLQDEADVRQRSPELSVSELRYSVASHIATLTELPCGALRWQVYERPWPTVSSAAGK